MGRAHGARPGRLPARRAALNLDAKLRAQMRPQIKRLHEGRTTALYVTHDQVEAMTLADRLVVMNDGRRRADRHAARGLRAPGQRLRRRLHRLAGDEPHAATVHRRGHVARRRRGLVRRRPYLPSASAQSTSPMLFADAEGAIPSTSRPSSSSAPTPSPGHLPGDPAEFVVRLPGSTPPGAGERLTVRAEPLSSTSSIPDRPPRRHRRHCAVRANVANAAPISAPLARCRRLRRLRGCIEVNMMRIVQVCQ